MYKTIQHSKYVKLIHESIYKNGLDNLLTTGDRLLYTMRQLEPVYFPNNRKNDTNTSDDSETNEGSNKNRIRSEQTH